MKRRKLEGDLSDSSPEVLTLTKSEIQTMISQEVEQAVKHSDKMIQSLMERIQELNAEPKHANRIKRLEAHVKKLKRRGDSVFTYIRKNGGSELFQNQKVEASAKPVNTSYTHMNHINTEMTHDAREDLLNCGKDKKMFIYSTGAREGRIVTLNKQRSRTPNSEAGTRNLKEPSSSPPKRCSDAGALVSPDIDSDGGGARKPKEGFWQSLRSKTQIVDLTDEDKECKLNGKTNANFPLKTSPPTVKEDDTASPCERPVSPGLSVTDSEASMEDAQAVLRARLPPFPDTPFPSTLPTVAATKNMPQKPVVKVARIENPVGIALLWNIEQEDPHAPEMDCYYIYVSQKHDNGTCSMWKAMGIIKAMPLPMACRLSDRSADKTLYFIIVGKDIYGRYGPYSDVQTVEG